MTTKAKMIEEMIRDKSIRLLAAIADQDKAFIFGCPMRIFSYLQKNELAHRPGAESFELTEMGVKAMLYWTGTTTLTEAIKKFSMVFTQQLTRQQRTDIAIGYFRLYSVGSALTDFERDEEDCAMDNAGVPDYRWELNRGMYNRVLGSLNETFCKEPSYFTEVEEPMTSQTDHTSAFNMETISIREQMHNRRGTFGVRAESPRGIDLISPKRLETPLQLSNIQVDQKGRMFATGIATPEPALKVMDYVSLNTGEPPMTPEQLALARSFANPATSSNPSDQTVHAMPSQSNLSEFMNVQFTKRREAKKSLVGNNDLGKPELTHVSIGNGDKVNYRLDIMTPLGPNPDDKFFFKEWSPSLMSNDDIVAMNLKLIAAEKKAPTEDVMANFLDAVNRSTAETPSITIDSFPDLGVLDPIVKGGLKRGELFMVNPRLHGRTEAKNSLLVFAQEMGAVSYEELSEAVLKRWGIDPSKTPRSIGRDELFVDPFHRLDEETTKGLLGLEASPFYSGVHGTKMTIYPGSYRISDPVQEKPEKVQRHGPNGPKQHKFQHKTANPLVLKLLGKLTHKKHR